jgi:hypothetical protein
VLILAAVVRVSLTLENWDSSAFRGSSTGRGGRDRLL